MKILAGILLAALLIGYAAIILASTILRAGKGDEGMDDPTNGSGDLW